VFSLLQHSAPSPPPPLKTFGCLLQNITTIKLLQPQRSPTFRTTYKWHPHIKIFPTSSDNLDFYTNIYRNSLISLFNKIGGGQTALSISVTNERCFSFFTFLPRVLTLSKFYLFTNWCTQWVVLNTILKFILKFTLKQLRHVSVQLHRNMSELF